MRDKIVVEVGNFLGPKGQLEVLEKYLKSFGAKKRRVCLLKCHVCKLDPELFGEAVFESDTSNVYAGKLPCGCSKNPRMSTEQVAVRIKRICESKGYTFLAFLTEGTNHLRRRISVNCNKCDNSWECDVGNFLNGRNCPACAYKTRGMKRMSPDEKMVETFLKNGVFKEGTTFARKIPGGRLWKVECPACPGETFISDFSNLRVGKRPCHCGTGGGFDVKLPASVYVLKVAGASKFTGYGISNFLHRRLVSHKRELSKVGMYVEETFSVEFDKGCDALSLENTLKRAFEINSQNVEGFRREATHYEHYQDVVDFVEKQFDKT